MSRSGAPGRWRQRAIRRLASAEVVPDAASRQLDEAPQQQPDAIFLVGLITSARAASKLARLGLMPAEDS
ncbi:MAG: hypothetical protein IPQ17_10890 [Xanthomonadales bacterium]|nr:hypothetical protein [Xanthomonadales bacterium]